MPKVARFVLAALGLACIGYAFVQLAAPRAAVVAPPGTETGRMRAWIKDDLPTLAIPLLVGGLGLVLVAWSARPRAARQTGKGPALP